MKFVNYSVIDHELLNKIIHEVGKVTKSPSHLAWSFCSRLYLAGSNKRRAYLFFIYGQQTQTKKHIQTKTNKHTSKQTHNHLEALPAKLVHNKLKS